MRGWDAGARRALRSVSAGHREPTTPASDGDAVFLGGQPMHRKRSAGFQDVRALNWAWSLDSARALKSRATETKQRPAARSLRVGLFTIFGTDRGGG